MSRIPIRNIYVMLAYASREAGLLDDRSIGACDFERPLDLVARLLDASMRRLRRQGLHREYIAREEEGPSPRGSIDITRTIARLLPARSELAWSVDELLPDTPCNRVLKSALRALLANREVSDETRIRLRHHVATLESVTDVPAGEALHARAAVPRAQPAYRSALRLARLALEHLLPDVGQSGAHWQGLLSDPDRMGDLFEKFVRGFASYELRDDAKVSAPWLYWDVAVDGPTDASLLPVMQTDVFLDWGAGGVTVCECKFYKEPLGGHHAGSGNKLISNHLYQLTAYLRAAERERRTRPAGLLLYAMAEEPIDGEWVLEGFPFRVSTVDLSKEWGLIRDEVRQTLLDSFPGRPFSS